MLKWRMNCSLFLSPTRSEAWRHLMDTVPCLTLSEMLMLQTLPTHSPLINLDIDRKKLNSISIDGIVHYTIYGLSLGLHVRYARLLQIQN